LAFIYSRAFFDDITLPQLKYGTLFLDSPLSFTHASALWTWNKYTENNFVDALSYPRRLFTKDVGIFVVS
jgi:hypothetical protein